MPHEFPEPPPANTALSAYQRPILRPPFKVFFRATLNEADVVTDLWEPASADASVQVPIFANAKINTLTISSTSPLAFPAGDGGRSFLVQGLNEPGDFQSQVVTLGTSPATVTTTTIWRTPLARIKILGAAGDRTGAVGTITAAIDGTIAGQINAGEGKSHTGHREIPRGEQWLITTVTTSQPESAEAGKVDATVTFGLGAAHPDEPFDILRDWRIAQNISSNALGEYFNGGSHFVFGAQTDTPGVIVSGIARVDTFALTTEPT